MQLLKGSLTVHTDCRFYRGDLPCKPHKEFGYHCEGCPAYQQIGLRILLIKLGAIGDVIRTTPLLRRLKKEYPTAKITWLTHTPAILPASEVDEILKFDFASVLYLKECQFDIIYNLDKDKEACALMNALVCERKFGYALEGNVAVPVNALAHHKFSTGLFDDISKANTKSYVREIFEMAGWEFAGEEYLFDNHQDKGYRWDLPKGKKLIGLNTGCGDRWTTRLWEDEKWITLIRLLQSKGYEPVLLGGEQEHEKNQYLKSQTGASYLGCFPLQQFINLMHQMDLIVTQVTMAMHIAVALRKQLVLMNNIFNPHEFEMYDRGFLLSPDKACDCYFLGKCKHGSSCMTALPAEKVLDAVERCLRPQ